jgi:hypothetical protein
MASVFSHRLALAGKRVGPALRPARQPPPATAERSRFFIGVRSQRDWRCRPRPAQFTQWPEGQVSGVATGELAMSHMRVIRVTAGARPPRCVAPGSIS